MEEQSSKIKTSILSRVSLLYLIFFCVFVSIIIKIVWIQLGTDSKELRGQSIQYSYRSEVIPAARGNVLASDGRLLSTSISMYEIRMDLKARGLEDSVFNNNVEPLAAELSTFFGDKSQAQYSAELRSARKQGKGYHLVTRRKINYIELQRVKDFPLFRLGPNRGGFLAVEMGRRVQPHGELASRVIGFVNNSGIKVGIEGSFDNRLRGIDGITIKQKISGSFWIPISSPLNIEAQAGLDVRTTLDIELQDIAQQALRERLVEVNATWGTVIVMEVETGHIKAIANATNKRDIGKVVEDYNYALGMSMEPGSTFKMAGLLAVLDDGGMSVSSMVDTEGGTVFIGKAKVVDTRRGGYGTIPLQEVFEHSSNIGMAKAVNQCYGSNPDRFVDFLQNLKLDKPLGLQLAGEARPVIRRQGERGWDGTSLTMMAYGYALRITPIQTLTLCNAIANGGKMVKPLFVTELLRDGRVVEEYPTEVLSPMIASPKTIASVRMAMEGVVERGTAKSLRNPMYSVAAKTGTAQIAKNGGYFSNGGRYYLGSVVGYFPAQKPKYTIMIAIETFHREGSSDPYYGGALASPLFKTIADRIFTTKYDFLTPLKAHGSILTPDVRMKSAPQTDELAVVLGGMRISASRRMIEAQMGMENRGLQKQTAAENDSTEVILTTHSSLPAVRGYVLNDAVKVLEREGYVVRSVGRGTVREVIIDTLNNHSVELRLAP